MATRHRLLTGRVLHARLSPKRHRFKYRLSMLFLDLDHLKDAFKDRWFWSLEKANLATFRRRDYLPGTQGNLAEAARQLVEQATGTRPEGSVLLMTQPRYFGLCFNPISLFFCHNKFGEPTHVILEVHNTPWNERHPYVLDLKDGKEVNFDKALHVSPFMDIDMSYRFSYQVIDGEIMISLENYRGEDRLFIARMQLQEQPLNAAACSYALLGTPFMTFKIVLAIYWQALRLWLKGIPFVSHPKQDDNRISINHADSLKEKQ